MTTRKGFKRVVRARMAKTGERYAAARRALTAEATRAPSEGAHPPSEPTASGYVLRGGRHPETASVANVLAARGVTSGLDGRPLTEAMILGIGGGLGAGYILWEFGSRPGPILTLGFTNGWQYPGRAWSARTAARLGIATEAHETSGPKSAARTLDAVLARGRPAIAFVDQQVLGTWGQPDALAGVWGYQVVVFERWHDGAYLVDDRGRAPLVVDAPRMAAARARITSFRHRLFVPQPEAGAIPADRLRAAILSGLEDQVRHLGGPSDSFSLPAWRKWARMLTDTRNAKGWPQVFAGGRGLFDALLSIVEGVDGSVGAQGGHLRDLYADFLDEAAPALDRPQLADAARAWRVAADLWEDLADAALPEALPDAADAVEAAEALHEAVMEGESGRSRARAAAATLWTARARSADGFPWREGEVAELFGELSERLTGILAAERAALAATAAAIGVRPDAG